MEWQPIETAPRDGSTILIGSKGFVSEAKYGSYKLRGEEKVGWHWYDADDSWYSMDFDGLSPITHWMPLPPPPETDK